MIYRKLMASDELAEAVQLLQRFFREEGFTTLDETIAVNTHILAASDMCGLFVAEDNGKTVGVATVSLEFGIEYGWSAEMGDLYVLPDWRGKGVSRDLVDHVEAFLLSRGVNGYEVTVTPFAAEEHGLEDYYRQLGFDHEGRVIMFKTIGKGK
jgi:GNAT superfamily N-acetyltransferase